MPRTIFLLVCRVGVGSKAGRELDCYKHLGWAKGYKTTEAAVL